MNTQTLALAVLVAFLLGGFGGYQHGRKVQRGEAAEEISKAFVKLIDHHNELTAAEVKAATQAEKARQAYQQDALRRKNRVLQDALAKANPVCDRDDESLGMLIDSIRAANGDSAGAPTGKVPDSVPDHP